MRAGRLLTLLLTLQEHGRMTATALATRLEVSRRTVLRDVQTLGEAGVPIVTFHGPGGGIELLPGWRAALGGIGADHGAGLLLAGHPLLARALGLGAAADAARTALLAALPPPDRARVTALEDWLLVDPAPAPGFAVDAPLLQNAARAAREHLALELTTPEGTRAVQPAGLLLRGGRWLLVVPPDDETEAAQVLPLDTVTRHRLLPGRAPGGTRTRTRALLRRLPLPLGYGGGPSAGCQPTVPATGSEAEDEA
jgi:predicted DNA-binding transcriptional regulator YafY